MTLTLPFVPLILLTVWLVLRAGGPHVVVWAAETVVCLGLTRRTGIRALLTSLLVGALDGCFVVPVLTVVGRSFAVVVKSLCRLLLVVGGRVLLAAALTGAWGLVVLLIVVERGWLEEGVRWTADTVGSRWGCARLWWRALQTTAVTLLALLIRGDILPNGTCRRFIDASVLLINVVVIELPRRALTTPDASISPIALDLEPIDTGSTLLLPAALTSRTGVTTLRTLSSR
jgi:hypothetical protein